MYKHTHTYIQAETERHAGRQAYIHADTHSHKCRIIHTDRQTTHTETHTGIHTGIHTYSLTDWPTYIQRKSGTQAHTWTGRHTDCLASIQTYTHIILHQYIHTQTGGQTGETYTYIQTYGQTD